MGAWRLFHLSRQTRLIGREWAPLTLCDIRLRPRAVATARPTAVLHSFLPPRVANQTRAAAGRLLYLPITTARRTRTIDPDTSRTSAHLPPRPHRSASGCRITAFGLRGRTTARQPRRCFALKRRMRRSTRRRAPLWPIFVRPLAARGKTISDVPADCGASGMVPCSRSEHDHAARSAVLLVS